LSLRFRITRTPITITTSNTRLATPIDTYAPAEMPGRPLAGATTQDSDGHGHGPAIFGVSSAYTLAWT
jgi:hypothetical protein